MIDLKSCCNQQLAEIDLIIQESVGVERLPIKLFTKLLPNIEHYICTSYRVSKKIIVE